VSMIRGLSSRCGLRGSGVFRKLHGCMGAFGAIAPALVDVDDDGAMEETIQNGVSNRGIAQNRPQFLETDSGGDNEGRAILTGADELKEEARVFGFGSDMIHAVNDQQMEPSKLCEELVGGVIGEGCIEDGQELLELEEMDLEAGFTGPDSKRGRQVSFAGTGFTHDEQGLMVRDKVEVLQVL
jgi:hypothetical protein